VETAEKIDVLSDCGIRTGEVLSKKEVHKLGRVHRAVHLYLFDCSNRLLLQRRSPTTDHYPGKLSISVTGHVQAGESSSAAMRREFYEELGLHPADVKIDFLFSFRQDAAINATYIDRQLNDVYMGRADFQVSDLVLETDAVHEVKLVDWSAFHAMVLEDKEELAPVYARALQDVMYFLEKIKIH